MPKTVPFTVKCPVCGGSKKIKQMAGGFGNTDGSVELDCWRCQQKGYLQQGHIRLDRLLELYMFIQVKDIKCTMCNASGIRKDGTGKTCKACMGYRIKTHSVILELPEGTITLHDYITKDD